MGKLTQSHTQLWCVLSHKLDLIRFGKTYRKSMLWRVLATIPATFEAGQFPLQQDVGANVDFFGLPGPPL